MEWSLFVSKDCMLPHTWTVAFRGEGEDRGEREGVGSIAAGNMKAGKDGGRGGRTEERARGREYHRICRVNKENVE